MVDYRQGRYVSSAKHKVRLWDSPCPFFNWYLELFSQGKSGKGVKLATHLHIVPRLSMRVNTTPLPHIPLYRGALIAFYLHDTDEKVLALSLWERN